MLKGLHTEVKLCHFSAYRWNRLSYWLGFKLYVFFRPAGNMHNKQSESSVAITAIKYKFSDVFC